MSTRKLHFETLQLHVGQEHADPASDARAVPIYQTSSYVFHNCDHAAARFGLTDPGNIYSRLTNSTQDVLEQRIAALEGGVGALAVASGAAAITYSILNITRAGDHVVAAKTIYGGTYDLLQHTLVPYGISTTFVDPSDLGNFERAIRPETKLLFIETFGNPNGNVIDIEKVAETAHRHNIPLVASSFTPQRSSSADTEPHSVASSLTAVSSTGRLPANSRSSRSRSRAITESSSPMPSALPPTSPAHAPSC